MIDSLADCQLFHDLLSCSYVYHCVWSVMTADNFISAKCDELFWVMFTEPVVSLVIGHSVVDYMSVNEL